MRNAKRSGTRDAGPPGSLVSGPRRLATVVAIALVGGSFATGGSSLQAQGNNRAVPRANYYLALSVYNEGKFATALEGFQAAGGSGIRSTQGRWVDSICYYAMVGECHYQLGNMPQALAAFDAALELVVAHRDWMLRVQFSPGLEPDRRRIHPPVSWGRSTRRTERARFPETMLSLQGDPNIERALAQGGVIQPPDYLPLNVAEVVRCSALAMRRRMEIMGPTCRHVPLTDRLVAALSRRPAPPNHWSQSWVGALLGLAYASDGQFVQAIGELRQSLAMAGRYDHGLTGVALLELGKLATRQGNLQAAAEFFLEATYTAAEFEQYDVLAEAFHQASTLHLVQGGKIPFAPLVSAADWADRESRLLHTGLLANLAEQLTSAREPQRAAELIGRARRNLGRAPSTLSNRLQYVQALAAYQGGDASAGDASLAAAIARQRESSLRLLQIDLADKLFLAGTLSPRIAEELYAEVLRDPSAEDWSLDPLESLTVLTTPHPLPFEHWFEVALLRKNSDLALEIADLARRHRFYVALPLGGRLLSLRWILEAPVAALSEQAVLRRNDLLVRYPGYAQLSRQDEAIRGQLQNLPLAAPEADARSAQEELFGELARNSSARELLLREMALSRQPAPLVFPPRRSLKEVREGLPADTLVLAYFSTSRGMYGFAFGRESYEQWQVESPEAVRRELVQLLRAMGHYEKSVTLGVEDLENESWKGAAADLLARLTGNRQDELLRGVEELVLVPHGSLWYLPFEALPIPVAGADSPGKPLITQVRVRTVPTVSLAIPDDRGAAPLATTAIVTGRIFPRDDDQYALKTATALQRVLPGAERLQDPLPAPSSLLAVRCGRLVVWDSLDDLDRGPFAWSPLPLDRGKAGSTLADWLSLPFGGPVQIVLPGYHTAAENSLKQGGNGDEVFLSVCGLMAGGARSLLLSRWRVGGQSCMDLMREFCQELPHVPAADAWQRSVLLSMRNDLDPQSEPRLQSFNAARGPRADHPFFWSGYLLIDSGHDPRPRE